MLCEECHKKEAEMTITIITTEGKVVEKHLCKECAYRKGFITEKEKFKNILEVFSEFLKEKISAEEEKIVCPSCGMSWAEFKKIGRLGCAGCYIAFGDRLKGLIKKMHDSDKHIGKKPSREKETLVLKEMEIKRLKKKLEEAVKNEKYEEAARIRDMLKKYEVGE